MTTRSVRAPFAAVIALLLPLSLVACEDKGVPAVPAPDTAVATDTAEPHASSTAAPADTAGAKVEDKTASADGEKEEPKSDGDTKEPKDADPKPGAGADPKTATGDTKAAPEPAKDEPAPTVGEKKTEGSYAAWLQSSGKYSVDKPGTVVAVVSAQGEYKCNDKYPYKFKLNAPPPGVSYGADTVRGASIGKKQTSLSIPFTPSSAGAKTISGTFYFSVCNEETCQIKKQPMSVTVNVE